MWPRLEIRQTGTEDFQVRSPDVPIDLHVRGWWDIPKAVTGCAEYRSWVSSVTPAMYEERLRKVESVEAMRERHTRQVRAIGDLLFKETMVELGMTVKVSAAEAFAPFRIARCGLKWRILVVDKHDGVARATASGTFWRWRTAALVAAALVHARQSGERDAKERR